LIVTAAGDKDVRPNARLRDKTVDIHVANEEHLLRALRKDVH
jgi:hypothetical protein